MATAPLVAFLNRSTVVSDSDVDAMRVAIGQQVTIDFAPYWQDARTIFVPKGGVVPPSAWQLVFLDDPKHAGALGFHDLTKAGLPLGKVFAKTTLDAGDAVSVTASHELLEMLADPSIDRVVQVGTGTFYALEVCDACEADAFGYVRNGIRVSDFVTPAWFDAPIGPFDFGQHVGATREILSEGYIGSWTCETGWAQKTSRGEVPPDPPEGSRRERRFRGKAHWRRSTS